MMAVWLTKKCRMDTQTLDAAADGYVRGEACGALLLERHDAGAAVACGGALLLLAGTAVNQDGRSSTLTAPNGA